MKCIQTIFFLFSICLLTHCESYDLSRRIVQQGNLLPASKVQRLKIGMTKEEVSLLIGSTLTHNIFRENHLDYAYTWRRGGSQPVLKYLCLTFQNNRLIRIDQNVVPHS